MLKFLKDLFTSESEPERIPVPSPLATAICISMKEDPKAWKLIFGGGVHHEQFGLTIHFSRQCIPIGDVDEYYWEVTTNPDLNLEQHDQDVIRNAYEKYIIAAIENEAKLAKEKAVADVTMCFLKAYNPPPTVTETEALQSFFYKTDAAGA